MRQQSEAIRRFDLNMKTVGKRRPRADLEAAGEFLKLVADLRQRLPGHRPFIRRGVCWIELQGVKIPFANAALMRELKQTLREKDRLDLQFLDSLTAKKN